MSTRPAAASSGWWQRWRGEGGDGPLEDPENLIELARLERLIRRSSGFRVAFASVDDPSLYGRIAAAARRDLEDATIAEIALEPESAQGVVPAIERAAESRPAVIFALGLEQLRPLRERSPGIAELNLNRDWLARAVPMPVVFFAPDFAIRGFARQAADLWSVRSGVFRFRSERGGGYFAATAASDGLDWSASPEERREREALLHDLLDEATAAPAPPAARAAILSGLGRAAERRSAYADAERRHAEALSLYRDVANRVGEANTLKSLGDAALVQGRYRDAIDLYQQALPIYRDIGDRLGEANTLKSLGDTALMEGRYRDAIDLYQQALPIYRDIGNRLGEANALHGLASAARSQGRNDEAVTLFQDTLRLYRELDDRRSEAITMRAYANALAAADSPAAESAREEADRLDALLAAE